MNAKRATIGRTFKQSTFAEESNETAVRQTFTLASGRKAEFILQTIPAPDVAESTFVNQDTNGRDQAALTPESLKDITRTLRFQQFFPCIGIQSGHKIEIIDGSRRRAAAMLCQSALNVMVTKTTITSEDARKLASAIQTAKEHNIREVGLRLLTLKKSGLSQKEIAVQEGLSQAKVTRALKAAAVSPLLLSVFPVQSELSFSDYKFLADAEDLLGSKGIEIDSLITNITEEVNSVLTAPGLLEDEVKNRIIKIILKESALLATVPGKEKSLVSNLCVFTDKDRFARKRVRGRMFSYEFNRLSREVQDELDAVILEVLRKHN